MIFSLLRTRARKEHLGPNYLNLLRENCNLNGGLARVGHDRDGRHNALEVARAVASFSWSGSAWSIDTGSTAQVTNVAAVSTGIVDVTLSASYFSLPMVPRFSALHADGESLPIIGMVIQTSATSLRVCIRKLASLGGNTWNLFDGDFALAIHAAPFANAAPDDLPDHWVRRQNLADDVWNELVVNQGERYAALVSQHTSGGLHNTREVPRGFARVTSNGAGTSTLADSYRVDSVTRVSNGRNRLNLPAGYTTPMQVFGEAEYLRTGGGSASDVFVVCWPKSQHTTAKVEAFTYEYDVASNTWSAQDVDFTATIHTAPG